ncbi:alpha/beta fold hydrolase [Streptomyces sp. NPDC008122]|uniref:alpha/beta fold hydrolase n=1 Tax=Streptomyces sp. NPDC008122 TaxID=3364810 RepID=UPI0036E2687D
MGARLRLLGQLRLEYDAAPVGLCGNAQRLPAFVGVHGSVSRSVLAGAAPTRTLRLPEGVNDIERYADHVESAIADLDDFVPAGDSFGANIALALATRRPQGLRALVVSGGFAADPVDSKPWKALMRAIGKARGPFYRQLTLRAHAHRLASPFDGEGRCPGASRAAANCSSPTPRPPPSTPACGPPSPPTTSTCSAGSGSRL